MNQVTFLVNNANKATFIESHLLMTYAPCSATLHVYCNKPFHAALPLKFHKINSVICTILGLLVFCVKELQIIFKGSNMISKSFFTHCHHKIRFLEICLMHFGNIKIRVTLSSPHNVYWYQRYLVSQYSVTIKIMDFGISEAWIQV